MKILEISPYFLPHEGGIEKYVFRLSRDLAKEGHEVTIFSSMIPKEAKSHERMKDFEVYRFPTSAILLRNPLSSDMVTNIVPVLNTYDLINCHDEHGFTSNIVAFAKLFRVTKTPVVLTSHGCSFNPLVTSLDFVNRMYDQSLGVLTFKMATSIVALSSFDKDYISRVSGVDPQKVKVIPNAIDISHYDVDIDPTPFVNKYELRNKKTVLYVGSLVERKGVHHLIAAASKVVENVKEVRFVIVGTGYYRETLESYVRELDLDQYFVFTGRISDRDIMRAYRACVMVVLPSLAEGVPSVIQEALLFSKPVISSDLPGIHEYFRKYVFLVPPADPTILGQAILRVLGDEEGVQKFTANGRHLILDYLNWKNIFHNIKSFYIDTLNNLN